MAENSGPKEGVKGAVEDVKGKVKEGGRGAGSRPQGSRS